MKNIDAILRDYTAGEADLETTNAALAESGAGFSLAPGQNDITEADRQETTVGYYPSQANGYGLLDTGTGTLDKVPVKAGKLPFAVNEVQPDGSTNSFAQVVICGRVYEVFGDTLGEIREREADKPVQKELDMSRRMDLAGQTVEQSGRFGRFRVIYDSNGYAVKARRM